MRRGTHCLPERWSEEGYILILTIVMLAILTVAASFVSQRISSAQTLARNEQAVYQASLAMNNARSHLLRAVAAATRGSRGLLIGGEEIFVDGRWYEYDRDIAVALQDTRGLINLNIARREMLGRLLGTYRMEQVATGAAVDALLDYVDSDDLTRLQGAEAPQYASAGLPAPRNAPLISPLELGRVFGWRDQVALWGEDGILNHTYVDPTEGYINPNTATWRVLVASFGLTEADAKRMVQQRVSTGIDLYPLLVGEVDLFDSPFLRTPGRSFVMTLASRQMRQVLREQIVLTPQSAKTPWRVAYSYRFTLGAAGLPERIPKIQTEMTGADKQQAAQSSPESGTQDILLPF